MSHKTRVERHIVVDILAGVFGASLVTSVTNRSWLAAALALVSGFVLLVVERNNIQQEDSLERIEPLVLHTEPERPSLSEKDIKILRKKSLHPASNNIPNEGLAYYIAGLEDGAATTSQWVLNQLEDSE